MAGIRKNPVEQGTPDTEMVPETVASALAPRPESALAAFVPDGGWEDPSVQSEADERVIPYVRLLQGLSQEVKDQTAKIGDLMVSTGINLGKWVRVVPLWHDRGAIMYDDRNEKIECRSLDGVNGNMYGVCSACEYNWKKWTQDEKGNTHPPRCTKLTVFPCIVLESENFSEEQAGDIGIVSLQFARSSATVAKQIITAKELAGVKDPSSKPPFYAFKWHLSSRDKKFEKGEAKVFTARYEGKVDHALMLQCHEACKAWAGARIEVAEGSEFGAERAPSVDKDEAPF